MDSHKCLFRGTQARTYLPEYVFAGFPLPVVMVSYPASHFLSPYKLSKVGWFVYLMSKVGWFKYHNAGGKDKRFGEFKVFL